MHRRYREMSNLVLRLGTIFFAADLRCFRLKDSASQRVTASLVVR